MGSTNRRRSMGGESGDSMKGRLHSQVFRTLITCSARSNKVGSIGRRISGERNEEESNRGKTKKYIGFGDGEED